MKKQIERRDCDQCGMYAEQVEKMIGGSKFSGWLTITRTDGRTQIPLSDAGPWDFCGDACAVAFLSGKRRGEP